MGVSLSQTRLLPPHRRRQLAFVLVGLAVAWPLVQAAVWPYDRIVAKVDFVEADRRLEAMGEPQGAYGALKDATPLTCSKLICASTRAVFDGTRHESWTYRSWMTWWSWALLCLGFVVVRQQTRRARGIAVGWMLVPVVADQLFMWCVRHLRSQLVTVDADGTTDILVDADVFNTILHGGALVARGADLMFALVCFVCWTVVIVEVLQPFLGEDLGKSFFAERRP